MCCCGGATVTATWSGSADGCDHPAGRRRIIWVLTPKTGKPGHVLPAEIAESAPTAGLMQTSSANLGTPGAPADWSNRNQSRRDVIRDARGRC